MRFRDAMYGEIQLPDWIDPFLRLPEFVRLRGVRLSNIDSIQYKDFGSATRYDHAIGVTHLALRAAKAKRLDKRETVHLALAALLHDVGTPPFGHTFELVFDDIDHELECFAALGIYNNGTEPTLWAFRGELPQFEKRCCALSRTLGIGINPELIGQMINGGGDLGFLIRGTLDLDNADNVLRGAHYMGIPTSGKLAEDITDWLSTHSASPSLINPLPPAPSKWVEFKNEYYRLFYDCDDAERGRQALLQFILREAWRQGLPKERMLRTTDEGLLQAIEGFTNSGSQGEHEHLADAVRKFRLLEPLTKVAEIYFDDEEAIATFRIKSNVSLLEERLRSRGFVPMVFYARRSFSESIKPPGKLFGYSTARLSIFALREPKRDKRSRAADPASVSIVTASVSDFIRSKPWRLRSEPRDRITKESLNSWGDWSFRHSRNESLHTYPSTYVYAIPAAFLKSLRLAGDLILDPFCGSGVTGVEAALSGCRAVCADVSEIALLISKVRSTYLDPNTRRAIREISREDLESSMPGALPSLPNLDSWHHPDTQLQLASIKGFVLSWREEYEKQFLLACFSAILTSTTARRGKQHGWFADNTPLAKGALGPPAVDAIGLFLARIERNLAICERVYAAIERKGEDPREVLGRIKTVRADATCTDQSVYGIEPGSVGGVITSPPYLGMSDYSLGQRLSYAWLFPGLMERDFADEMGARRRRFKVEQAVQEYKKDMDAFANLCSNAIRTGGFVALVLGAPEAQKFASHDLLGHVDTAFQSIGFQTVWESWRPISWHRNHGYQHLKTEKLTVFEKVTAL